MKKTLCFIETNKFSKKPHKLKKQKHRWYFENSNCLNITNVARSGLMSNRLEPLQF